MKEKIHFLRFNDFCPEQYYAVDRRCNIVGYLRVRNGHIDLYCPDDESDEIIYTAPTTVPYAGSMAFREQRMHIRAAKKAIQKWLLEHSGFDDFNKLHISDGSAGEMLIDLIV